MQRAHGFYFYPDRIDQRMIIGALDALERRFDSVRFDAAEGASEGTLFVGGAAARVPLDADLTPDAFEKLLGRVLFFVEAGIPDEANVDEDSNLELIALRGALHALDRYSTIFSGQRTDDFRIRFTGKLSGIGARIGRRDGNLTAVRVFPDSPADKAGLVDGDVLDYIDGDPTRSLTVTEAVSRIRGEVGTPVAFDVIRGEEDLKITVIRGTVVVPSVETRDLEDGIGYVRITSVTRSTVDEFRAQVSELDVLRGLVLDLRGNTGGSMTAAAVLADMFVTDGTIVRVIDRKRDSSRRAPTHIAHAYTMIDAPVVVLVDESTASAAEILSGAIEPLDRVTLVGQKTFGKGVIQRVMGLPEKNLLKLTVGEYLLSGDRAIHEKGIEPNIELFPVPSQRLDALASVPEGAIPYVRQQGEDDTFPVEFAKQLLLDSDARESERSRSVAELQERMGELGVTWEDVKTHRPHAELPLPLPLRIELAEITLNGGKTAAVRIRVENPNDFAIPNAWAALDSPVRYLWNRLIDLGTIPAGGSASGQVEIEPVDGLSTTALAFSIRVASGPHALQSEPAEFSVVNHAPELEIEVTRVDDENLLVSLHNRGCCSVGALRIALAGTVRSYDDLLPGASETAELPVAGSSKMISILLQGAGVQRLIEIPVPDGHIILVPPTLRVERHGDTKVLARASASEGLRQGWIALDGQKEIYTDWAGSDAGTLAASLLEGEHSVTTKIETLTGVSIIDTRTFRGD